MILLLLSSRAGWEGRAFTRVGLRALVPPQKHPAYGGAGSPARSRAVQRGVWVPLAERVSCLWRAELGSPPSAFGTKFILQFAKKPQKPRKTQPGN